MPYYVHNMLNIIALVVLLLSSFVKMDAVPPYKLKNEANLERLIFRTEIPETTEEKQAKIGELSELEKKIRWVGVNVLATDGMEMFVNKAVDSVQKEKKDVEDAIDISKSEPVTGAIDLLKRYESDNNLMTETEIKTIRKWFLQQTASDRNNWLIRPETRTPMQIITRDRAKYNVEKVNVWPEKMRFPKFLDSDKPNEMIEMSRNRMMAELQSALETIKSRLKKDKIRALEALKEEWKLRLDLVDKFTSGATSATEISDRLKAFERIVLTLLTSDSDSQNSMKNVLKKWLLTSQMMYVFDGISENDGLAKAWDETTLQSFPIAVVKKEDMPVPKPADKVQKIVNDEEIPLDKEEKERLKVERRKRRSLLSWLPTGRKKQEEGAEWAEGNNKSKGMFSGLFGGAEVSKANVNEKSSSSSGSSGLMGWITGKKTGADELKKTDEAVKSDAEKSSNSFSFMGMFNRSKSDKKDSKDGKEGAVSTITVDTDVTSKSSTTETKPASTSNSAVLADSANTVESAPNPPKPKGFFSRWF